MPFNWKYLAWNDCVFSWWKSAICWDYYIWLVSLLFLLHFLTMYCHGRLLKIRQLIAYVSKTTMMSYKYSTPSHNPNYWKEQRWHKSVQNVYIYAHNMENKNMEVHLAARLCLILMLIRFKEMISHVKHLFEPRCQSFKKTHHLQILSEQFLKSWNDNSNQSSFNIYENNEKWIALKNKLNYINYDLIFLQCYFLVVL